MSNIFRNKYGALFNQACHSSNISIGNNNFGVTRMETIFEDNETILKGRVTVKYYKWPTFTVKNLL